MDLMYLLSNANFILTILIIIAASYHILYFKDILVHSGMRWFKACIIMFCFWAILTTLMSIAPNREFLFIVTNFFIVVPFITSSLFFMFCYEFALQRSVPKILYTSFPIAIIVFLLGWVNPYNLVYAVDVYSQEPLIPAQPNTIRFFINVILGYSFVVFACGMIFTELARSSDTIKRKQIYLLFGCTLLTVLLSLPKILSLNMNFDPILIAVLSTIIIFSYSIRSYKFGILISMASDKIIEESENIIIICDSENNIIKINKKAELIFGIESAKNIIKDIDKNNKSMVEITDNDKKRYFQVYNHQVGNHEKSGIVYSLSEVTTLKEQEEELEIYHKVINRVLRHNVRNEMNVITGYATEIYENESGETKRQAKIINKKSNSLYDTVKKLRKIQSAFDKKTNLNVNIAEKLTEVIEKSDYENLTINLKDNTEKNIVKVSHCINYAIEEIIDNGFCHNNSENKIINITIDEFDDDKIRIRFEDNGIGINEHEINVLKSKDETNHKHGSGSGLWLINWIINRSDGEVEFENISNGTRIEIILMKK